MTMDEDTTRALEWNRWAFVGSMVILFLLLLLLAFQFVLMRREIVDIRVRATALAVRVDSMDEHGTKALARHALSAHDRAK